jgi:hypothetical protein
LRPEVSGRTAYEATSCEQWDDADATLHGDGGEATSPNRLYEEGVGSGPVRSVGKRSALETAQSGPPAPSTSRPARRLTAPVQAALLM